MSTASNPSNASALSPQSGNEFDYIVVGAGASGCVIANRLTEDSQLSVLLLDAGGPEPVPRMDEFQLMGSRYDWKYLTEPQPRLNNRRVPWPRGKMFGGSSAMSSMVYLRGNRLDYANWNFSGNEGWTYDEVLPFFRKSEANNEFHNEFHGDSGPLSVELVTDNSTLKQAFFEAAEKCGYDSDPNWDFNGARQDGVAGIYQKTYKNGEPTSVGAAFLTPYLDRPNLVPRSFCLATRLLWDNNHISGVEYISNDWEIHTAHARREVVLCAGVVDSPHLLMLSGIGPAEHLRSHNIAVKMDLPGVGQNLQDHLNITLMYKPSAKVGHVNDRIGTVGLFLRTEERLQESSPDLQLFAFENIVGEAGRALGLEPGPLYLCTACAVRPQSRGNITLQSADPLAAPVIQPNYLECDRDLRVLLHGIKVL